MLFLQNNALVLKYSTWVDRVLGYDQKARTYWPEILHNSPIYDECQTKSAKVLPLSFTSFQRLKWLQTKMPTISDTSFEHSSSCSITWCGVVPFVGSVSFNNLEQVVSDWLLKKFNQRDSNTPNKMHQGKWKSILKLCPKMVLEVVCIFIWGHLGLWKDVHYEMVSSRQLQTHLTTCVSCFKSPSLYCGLFRFIILPIKWNRLFHTIFMAGANLFLT